MFKALEIVKIEEQTRDCKAFYFATDDYLKALPGQFLTFKFNIDGDEIRRSYSICTDPSMDEYTGVAVKKVRDGLISNYMNDCLKVGDTVEVMAPSGKFTVNADENHSDHLLLIAGGSGITPMLSILKRVLKTSPKTSVDLIYVNNSKEEVIFADQIKKLQETYSNNLQVIHYFNNEHIVQESPKKLFGILGKKKPANPYGFITADVAKAYFEKLGIDQNSTVYICGPTGLMELMEQTLLNMNFPAEQIKKEVFASPVNSDISKNVTLGVSSDISITVDGKEHAFKAVPNETILDAALNAGIELPYSCKEGNCTTCYCVRESGVIEMTTMDSLDEEDRAEGGVLTCVGYAMSDKVKLRIN